MKVKVMVSPTTINCEERVGRKKRAKESLDEIMVDDNDGENYQRADRYYSVFI
jgi:hypothetical protein